MTAIELINMNSGWKNDNTEIEIWSENGHRLAIGTATEIGKSFIGQYEVQVFNENIITVKAWAKGVRLANGESRITEITTVA